MAGALKVWDGTAWQTVSQQGTPGTPGTIPPVTSVDGRVGAVVLSDLYASRAQLIQSSRSIGYTTDAAGLVWVYFPTPFKDRATTTVVIQNVTDMLGVFCIAPHPNIEAAGFLLRVINNVGNPIVSSTVAVGYIAIGERP